MSRINVRTGRGGGLLFAAILGFFAFAGAEESPPVEETWQKNSHQWFEQIEAGGRLRVNNPYGNIYARFGGYENQVEILATIQRINKEIPELEVIRAETDGGLDVTVRPAATGDRRRAACRRRAADRVDLVIFVPKDVTLEARTEEGRIEVKGIKGDLEAFSVKGDLWIRGVEGYVRARTERGQVTATLETGVTTEHQEHLHADRRHRGPPVGRRGHEGVRRHLRRDQHRLLHEDRAPSIRGARQASPGDGGGGRSGLDLSSKRGPIRLFGYRDISNPTKRNIPGTDAGGFHESHADIIAQDTGWLFASAAGIAAAILLIAGGAGPGRRRSIRPRRPRRQSPAAPSAARRSRRSSSTATCATCRPPQQWQPGDPVKEIPRRFYPQPGADEPIADYEPGIDPLLELQQQLDAPTATTSAFTDAVAQLRRPGLHRRQPAGHRRRRRPRPLHPDDQRRRRRRSCASGTRPSRRPTRSPPSRWTPWAAALRQRLRRPDRALRPASRPLDAQRVLQLRQPPLRLHLADRRPGQRRLVRLRLHHADLPRLPEVRRLAHRRQRRRRAPTSSPPTTAAPASTRWTAARCSPAGRPPTSG